MVVQRVERVENELQHQRSSGPSSSSDVTPPRPKPPLIVKVCLYSSSHLVVVLFLQSEVRRVYRDLVESDNSTFTGFDL